MDATVVFSSVKKGYDPNEVNQYIILLQRSFESLEQEYNDVLSKKELLESSIKTTGSRFKEVSDEMTKIAQSHSEALLELGAKEDKLKEYESLVSSLEQELEKLKSEKTNSKPQLEIMNLREKNAELQKLMKDKDAIIKEQESKVDNLTSGLVEKDLALKDLEEQLNTSTEFGLFGAYNEKDVFDVFALAQKTTDEYIKNIKSVADNMNKDLMKKAREMEVKAKTNSEAIVKSAKDFESSLKQTMDKEKSSHEKQLAEYTKKANATAQKTVTDANAEASNIIEEAQTKAKSIIDNAKAEHKKIRELIKESTKQYMDICDKISDEETE